MGTESGKFCRVLLGFQESIAKIKDMLFFIPLRWILILFALSGCATKMIIPGNRFITPETQGSMFRGQMEYQQTSASHLIINADNGSVEDGVYYSDVVRSGFLFSNSLFDEIDFVWSHTGSSSSLLGGKFQFLGGSRTSNSAGHKAAFTAMIGGNNHETDDGSIDFDFGGYEYVLSYGYRFSENILNYFGLSYANYQFDGKLHSSDPLLNGLRPSVSITTWSLSSGFEISYGILFMKLEATYQQMAVSETADRNQMYYGYSFGWNW